VISMFGYMTELDHVDIDPDKTVTIEAKGHDMDSLVFSLLDEFLYSFSTADIIVSDIKITSFNRENWSITAAGYGEVFDLKKHPQGTEIKAITYSNMQIYEKETSAECFVIVDI
jgi:protein archease